MDVSEEIGTNVYDDKGDPCETYVRKREDVNPDDVLNSHDYFCNEVDETLGEKDKPAEEEPAHTWVIFARKREAITNPGSCCSKTSPATDEDSPGKNAS